MQHFIASGLQSMYFAGTQVWIPEAALGQDFFPCTCSTYGDDIAASPSKLMLSTPWEIEPSTFARNNPQPYQARDRAEDRKHYGQPSFSILGPIMQQIEHTHRYSGYSWWLHQ